MIANSNELINYDHFFSNEFKIGLFLPIALPFLYGIVHIFKKIVRKDDN